MVTHPLAFHLKPQITERQTKVQDEMVMDQKGLILWEPQNFMLTHYKNNQTSSHKASMTYYISIEFYVV